MNSVCGPRDAQRRLTEENSRQQQQSKWSARRLLRLSAVGVNNCTAGHTHTAQVEGITVVTAKRNSRSCTHTHTHTQHSVRERECKKENCSWTTLKIARFFFCCSCEKCQHEGKRILKCNQVFASF